MKRRKHDGLACTNSARREIQVRESASEQRALAGNRAPYTSTRLDRGAAFAAYGVNLPIVSDSLHQGLDVDFAEMALDYRHAPMKQPEKQIGLLYLQHGNDKADIEVELKSYDLVACPRFVAISST